MLKRFRYHITLVNILSTNYYKKSRFTAYCNNIHWFFSKRDYAERLVKQLDGEIISDHFGDNPALSIEGSTLHYQAAEPQLYSNTNDNKLSFDFHSHFADYSRQDAATTFEHMSINDTIAKNSVFLDHTDGYAKQYRSGNALYLLNILSLTFHTVIDRAVGAPGHGKSNIDGLIAVDKYYLRKVMYMSGCNRVDDKDTRTRCIHLQKNPFFLSRKNVEDYVDRKIGSLDFFLHLRTKVQILN